MGCTRRLRTGQSRVLHPLMYGKVRPGHAPEAQSRPSEILRALTTRAAEQGRLVAPPEQAAAHVLVTNIGVTLRQIILAKPDPNLSAAVREGTIAAITGTSTQLDNPLAAAVEIAASRADALGVTQTQLLIEWLTTLGAHQSP